MLSKWAILDLLAENVKKTGRVELFDKDGQVQLVAGALGELEGCATFVEETKKDPMWQTKYYGVSYWFKGITDNDIIDRVTITKRAFREIIKLFPFKINKLVESFIGIYNCEGGLKSKCLRQEDFCTACQELIRVGLKFAKDEMIKDLIFCLAMFLQFSPSYRVRVQDGLGELNQKVLKEYPLKEIRRIKNIIMSREKTLAKRWTMLFWGIMVLFFFPKYKKIIIDFLMELNIEKIKLDEADMYFCLRRSSYDFKGISFEDRLKEVERIDKEKNHLILGL